MTSGIAGLNECWRRISEERPHTDDLIPGPIIFEALALLAKSRNLEAAIDFIRRRPCGNDEAINYFRELGKAYLGIA